MTDKELYNHIRATMQQTLFKGKEKTTDKWVEGQFFAYPELYLCIASDKEALDNMLVYLFSYELAADWNFSNTPVRYQVNYPHLIEGEACKSLVD